MALTSDGGCFVCGENNPHGLRAHFIIDRGKKSIRTTYEFPETFQGYSGMVHGGILSLLLDEAMVKLAYEVGLPAVTGEITVRFPASLSTGEKTLVYGSLGRVDRRIILARAHAEKEDGSIVAEASARLFRRPPSKE